MVPAWFCMVVAVMACGCGLLVGRTSRGSRDSGWHKMRPGPPPARVFPKGGKDGKGGGMPLPPNIEMIRANEAAKAKIAEWEASKARAPVFPDPPPPVCTCRCPAHPGG